MTPRWAVTEVTDNGKVHYGSGMRGSLCGCHSPKRQERNVPQGGYVPRMFERTEEETMTDLPTLQEYYDQLERHDWSYDYSDDGLVYRRGAAAERGRLHAFARMLPEYRALYDGFQKHYFSGKPWNTEKQPKPERP